MSNNFSPPLHRLRGPSPVTPAASPTAASTPARLRSLRDVPAWCKRGPLADLLGGGLPGGVDSGDSIIRQYRAHNVSTIASQLTNPPGGFWLIYGEVCTWKGTGNFAAVVDDCPTATSPGQFVPARGTVDFNTNQATISGTMAVRFKDAE